MNPALWVGIFFVLLNTFFLIWYIFCGYQDLFHSDSAAKVLLAKEILETKEFFPSEWNYVNNDLSVSYRHAFIIPLLWFMPAGYLVHAISGLISAFILLSSIWLVTRITRTDYSPRIWIVAIIASGISGFMAENLYGQFSYGPAVFFSSLVLYLSYSMLRQEKTCNKLFFFLFFVAIILLFWANPQRSVIYYGVPLLCSLLGICLHRRLQIPRSRPWTVFAGLVGGAFVGTFLHYYTLSFVTVVQGAGSIHWISFADMGRNIGYAFMGLLAIFGGLPSPYEDVVSASGIYVALRLWFSLCILGLMSYAIFRSVRREQSGIYYLAVYALTNMVFVGFLYSTTSLPDMSDPIQSSRYFVPGLVIMLIVLFSMKFERIREPFCCYSTMACAVVLMTAAYPTYVGSDVNSKYYWDDAHNESVSYQDLTAFLQANDLRYGYATFWNAGVLSVLSREKVRVRQIWIDRGLPEPRRHLSSNRWYRPSAWQGKTFMLLTEDEAETVDWGVLERYQGMPVQTLEWNDFQIFVYDQNMARNIPGWDNRFEQPAVFLATKRSLSNVGTLDEDYAHNRPALVADKGEAGALYFGPYVKALPGRYTAIFDVLSEYAPQGGVRLDVAAANGQEILAQKTIPASSSPQSLTFDLEEEKKLEFRVWALGSARVAFKRVTVQRD